MERRRIRTRAAPALVACLLLAAVSAGPAHAQGSDLVLLGNAARPGAIDVWVAHPDGGPVTIFEEVGGSRRKLRTVTPDPIAVVLDLAPWRCDRNVRRFVASARSAGGGVLTASFETQTPSCRNRLSIDVPGAVGVGDSARVTISDRWLLGDLRMRLCRSGPGEPGRCEMIDLPRERAKAYRRVQFGGRGIWRVELRALGRRVRRTVFVGLGRKFVSLGGGLAKVLLTGDSMMMSLDNVLIRRLTGRADTRSDVRPGTGLSKPDSNWIPYARAQMAKRRPDATVVFLGANEGFDLETGGGKARCCGEDWIVEYASRVQTQMALYLRNGRSAALWLTIPAPRDDRMATVLAAVNEAIRRAASLSPGVRVLALDEFFTPGFRFSDTLFHNGRLVRVRADDGLHLSLPGASLAAGLVSSELEAVEIVQP